MNTLQLLGPPFAGAVWVVARLLLVHASVSGHQLDPHIHFFIDTLNQLGGYWPVASVFSHRLTSLLPAEQASDEPNSLENFRRQVLCVRYETFSQRANA